MQNYITSWRADFIIVSPIDGTLDYSGRIKENNLVQPGDRLFAIIPPENDLEVMIELPARASAKLKEDNQ